ncbi:homocitrate synthase [Pyrenophora seminiperda CCB06]|uniref:Homocitrate synthase n=1 Tax=Pyrenophora seminiperda CCB06 TaxID=1302712 RepID=A0A3M7LVF9_9PLEO|nr:homocitrate synthase [Pyrenophora seminiperda CCB06]
MPLHLLGKKSWNVYNADNIARVKADEAAALAREQADEQRMQELDAERRAAILRGQTPPPLPEEVPKQEDGWRSAKDRHEGGREKKRRKLAGEDDTDMDIRLAKSITVTRDDDQDQTKVLKLRSTANDAPLEDHAGNINLFPVDMKDAIKRERNAEAEEEKRKKERALEDQYTMRFANAAGKAGLDQPWYTAQQNLSQDVAKGRDLADYEGFVSKDVWGNDDPRRKEREHARISTKDPFAFMQKAQAQLKKSKQDKKRWTEERDRELKELRAAQEQDDRQSRHHKRERGDRNDDEDRVEVLVAAEISMCKSRPIATRNADIAAEVQSETVTDRDTGGADMMSTEVLVRVGNQKGA